MVRDVKIGGRNLPTSVLDHIVLTVTLVSEGGVNAPGRELAITWLPKL
jgi:hypothetical protein